MQLKFLHINLVSTSFADVLAFCAKTVGFIWLMVGGIAVKVLPKLKARWKKRQNYRLYSATGGVGKSYETQHISCSCE